MSFWDRWIQSVREELWWLVHERYKREWFRKTAMNNHFGAVLVYERARRHQELFPHV